MKDQLDSTPPLLPSEILLVTGNTHKLQEWQRAMPPSIKLRSVELDIPELQSDDPLEIAADKAKKAYAAVGQAVIVEDVSAGLDALGGLPGPFIKFFIKRLGQDALYQLAHHQDNARATVSCTAAYYDGKESVSVTGDVAGTIVSARGDSGFGFDVTFMPDGYEQTYAQMDASIKNKISHRAIAIDLLLSQLEERQLI